MTDTRQVHCFKENIQTCGDVLRLIHYSNFSETEHTKLLLSANETPLIFCSGYGRGSQTFRTGPG